MRILCRIAAECGRADLERLADEMSCQELEMWHEYLDENPPAAERLEWYLIRLSQIVGNACGISGDMEAFRHKFGRMAQAEIREEATARELDWIKEHGNSITNPS